MRVGPREYNWIIWLISFDPIWFRPIVCAPHTHKWVPLSFWIASDSRNREDGRPWTSSLMANPPVIGRIARQDSGMVVVGREWKTRKKEKRENVTQISRMRFQKPSAMSYGIDGRPSGRGLVTTTTETLYAVRKWLLCPLLPCVPSIHSHKSFGKANVLVRSVTSLQEPEDLFWWLVKNKIRMNSFGMGSNNGQQVLFLWAVVAITGTQQGAIVV